MNPMRILCGISAVAALSAALIAATQAPPSKTAPAKATEQREPGLYMTFETEKGSITCKLFENDTPVTVRKIVGLAVGKIGGKPFYDGLIFHQVIPGFLIQGGDPLGTGMGWPSKIVATGQAKQFTVSVFGMSNTAVTWKVNGIPGGNWTVGTISTSGLYIAPNAVPNPATVTITAVSQADSSKSVSASVTITSQAITVIFSQDFPFKDEFVSTLQFNVPGRLAMPNIGPNTNGSQFFITEVPMPHMNNHHTIFGQCENLDVVKAIARVPARNDKPITPVHMIHVLVQRVGPAPANAPEGNPPGKAPAKPSTKAPTKKSS